MRQSRNSSTALFSFMIHHTSNPSVLKQPARFEIVSGDRSQRNRSAAGVVPIKKSVTPEPKEVNR